jgi:multidrug efflux pump subunit AcrA (membrane-fusion protein)
MESAAGVSYPPGSLSLGSVIFEPNAIRVSSVPGSLGGPAAGQLLAATSDRHVVQIPVSTSEETGVAVGDAVTVTLPNGTNTPGKITSVGTVATGNSTNATIQVTVALTHPSAAGTLDQAPVTVYVTVGTASNVLVVPVAALVAQSSGGYAVEVIGSGDTRRLVPVTVGIFDDNSGVVQVTGALTPGEQVVVPAT